MLNLGLNRFNMGSSGSPYGSQGGLNASGGQFSRQVAGPQYAGSQFDTGNSSNAGNPFAGVQGNVYAPAPNVMMGQGRRLCVSA